ncbi:MAG TPA: hypothetical protein VEZ24_13080 [Microvirga sp.]|nr:hypothetical protein [Microvirga sp.]
MVSGIAVPLALQANALIGRDYLILVSETTASSLLADFFFIAACVFVVFRLVRETAWLLFRKTPHQLRMIDSRALVMAGFVRASPAILAIIAAGAYLGARLVQKPESFA